MHPAVPALALNRAPSHHRLACIPTPKAGGWHVAHYVICPLDQSTGGAHFFPALKKKEERAKETEGFKRAHEEDGRRTGERAPERDTDGGGQAARGWRTRESGSALPPKPVADQSPYVKRHFLWAPLGRPVCVIKIDLSPFLFFFERARERAGERDREGAERREGERGMTAGESEKREERTESEERARARESEWARERDGQREEEIRGERDSSRSAHRL